MKASNATLLLSALLVALGLEAVLASSKEFKPSTGIIVPGGRASPLSETLKGGRKKDGGGGTMNARTAAAAAFDGETGQRAVPEAGPPGPRPPPPLPPKELTFSDSDVGEDTPEQFADDVHEVLVHLRGDQYDPTVDAKFHAAKRPTFAVTWNHDMWDAHTSRWRFVDAFLHWHHSALAKRILPQMAVLMTWTVVAIWIVNSNRTPLSNIHLPMTSLSLISGFVASLLALRCNQGLERMLEARQAFGKVIFYSRDLASTIRHELYPLAPQVSLKLARHLSIFCWLLKNFLRGTKMNGDDEDLIRTMLPSKADADFVLVQRKKPVAVTMRLRQAMHELCNHRNVSSADELGIDMTIQALDESIMLTERIVASPIPPLFTTHAGRLLCFYLFFLPLALHGGGQMTLVGSFVTILAVGYAMLGLDEISYLMEQPFKVSPLYHLCKKAMRDVADQFCLHIPKLDARENHDYKPKVPPYWTHDVGQHDTFESFYNYNSTSIT